MKKIISSLLAVFGMALTPMLGAVSPAQATTPPTHCTNGTHLGVAAVMCHIDVNDDGLLNANDYRVIVAGKVLSPIHLDALANELDQAVVNVPLKMEDIILLREIVCRFFDEIDDPIPCESPILLPCGC